MEELIIGKIYSNSDLHRIFGCANSGGIRYVKNSNVIVLINNMVLDKSLNPYNNRWENDILIYTGEGLEGDQTLTKGNYRLLRAKPDRTKIFYFEVCNSKEYVYKCELKRLNTKTYSEEDQLDINGNIRRVLTFELLKS